ncbi:hypothetical protein L1787_24415 [Acuticoccus sp. M5D2P5]|uniref:hypothetical protein n=1 Tax=Acuticoccus kalidii TaxID=2910977 RepID=UPI001F2EBDBA|nr:hypothetical protein [Acuticoccus kalidii]MCF3936540.1 hypothetical protein [Acuticoccus kalidii]
MSPPQRTLEGFADLAVRVAWWLGPGVPAAPVTPVAIPRLAPMPDLMRIEPPGTVDPRIAWRLARVDALSMSVASEEADRRRVLDGGATGDTILATERRGTTDREIDALRDRGAILDGDPAANPEEALVWLKAGAILGRGADRGPQRAAWSALRRASAGCRRIVVVGPDIAQEDWAGLSDEVLALDPVLASGVGLAVGAGPVLVTLDDPVRHLGPSRSAADLRDHVIDMVEANANAFLCVPAAAGPLMRSRLPRMVWDRLIIDDVEARLDPGPATLLSVAASLADTVDVIGYGGTPAPLADDAAALHPAYAASAQRAADVSDIVAAAEAVGVRVAALGRTRHDGLAGCDRGRAPSHLADDAQAFGDAGAPGFSRDAASARRLRLSRHPGSGDLTLWRLGGHPGEAGRPLAVFTTNGSVARGAEPIAPRHPWPDDPHRAADLVLDIADAAEPALILTPVPDERGREEETTVAGLRGGLEAGEGPDGPFADEADERRALVTYHRLKYRDLDRLDAPRFKALANALDGGRTFVFAGFEWDAINTERLGGETVAVVDTPFGAIPQRVREEAGRILIVATNAAARLADTEDAPSVVRLTALSAAHRGSDADIVFDPADLVWPDEGAGAVPLAVRLLATLGVDPIVVVGAEIADRVAEPRVVGLHDSEHGVSVAAHFHDIFRADDMRTAPRILLCAGPETPLDLMERVFAGLGDRLAMAVYRDGAVRLVRGEQLVSGAKVALPAYDPGDAGLVVAIDRFAPHVMLLAEGGNRPDLPGVPVLALGRASAARPVAGRIDAPSLAEARMAEAAADRLRLAIMAASARARTLAVRRPLPERVVDEAAQRAGAVKEPPQWLETLRRSRPALSRAAVHFKPKNVTHGKKRRAPMSDTVTRRRTGLAALWPWPGNIFLVFLAAWLFYMGRIADIGDVQNAFFGLSGVTAFVLLFGLRAALVRRRHGEVEESYQEFGRVPYRRSVIPDEVEATPAPVPATEPADDDANVSADEARAQLLARARARANESVSGGAATPAEETSATITVPAPEPAIATRIEPVIETPITSGEVHSTEKRLEDYKIALDQLEAWINREKAERGAQLVKLENAIGDRIDALATRLESGVPAQTQREEVRAIVEETMGTAADPVPDPQLAALGERLSAMRTDIEASLSAGEADRAAIRNELRAVREVAEKAMHRAAEAGADSNIENAIATLKSEQAVDRRELASFRAALVSTGEGVAIDEDAATQLAAITARVEAVEKEAEARLAEADQILSEMRTSLAAFGDHVTKVEGTFGELMAWVGRFEDDGGERPSEQSVQAEVEALRDALTTIIEQNREIRAKQDILSARFDAPTRIEVDTRED